MRRAEDRGLGTQGGFNSRTREGCDPKLTQLIYDCFGVSIHAPGRGATGQDPLQRLHRQGFNSRTREGCDEVFLYLILTKRRFNSRTREGCDFTLLPLLSLISLVSIHAPGRGATGRYSKLSDDRVKFQFTHPGGVRRAVVTTSLISICVSIHAPGRGATLYYLIYFAAKVSFNSRTREGCDQNGLR